MTTNTPAATHASVQKLGGTGDFAYKVRVLGNAQRQIFAALPGLPFLVALVFLAALAAAGFTLYQAKPVLSLLHGATAPKSATYTLAKVPLTLAEYQATLDWFQRVQPDVKSSAGKEGITITIGAIDQHAEWLYALAALHSRDAGVVWEADSLCVGRCSGGAASAVVKGFRQQLKDGSGKPVAGTMASSIDADARRPAPDPGDLQ